MAQKVYPRAWVEGAPMTGVVYLCIYYLKPNLVLQWFSDVAELVLMVSSLVCR